jgi:hypothetical protein
LLRLAALAPTLSRAAALDDPIAAAMARIKPLFKPKTPPIPGERLADLKEPGQT